MDEPKSTEKDRAAPRPAWLPFVRTGQVVTCPRFHLPEGIVWANNFYIVVVRECPDATPDGPLVWLSIKSRDNAVLHDWRDLQRIKNELVGPEVEAVELYPAESRLVDNADNFHLWCFPGYRFPFGFQERMVSEQTAGVSQRPFDPDNRPPDLTQVVLSEIGYEVKEEPRPSEMRGRFPLGVIVTTRKALTALEQTGQSVMEFLARHAQCDWGEVDNHDRHANDRALREGGRLLSVYTLSNGQRIWLLTEADRSATTALLPEEY
jgi:hypothetical protein